MFENKYFIKSQINSVGKYLYFRDNQIFRSECYNVYNLV